MRRSNLILRALGLLSLLFVVVLASRCRTVNNHDDDSEMMGAPEKEWYGKDGVGAPCDGPAKACEKFDDDKNFVDVCVAKGFQAKTCGCSMRCSGRVTEVTAKAPAQDPAAAQLAADAAAKACPDDSKAFIQDTVAGRRPGSSLDRCIESHVCNGNLGWCTSDEKATTTKLRSLAGGKCEQEVYQGACKDGYVDSSQCAESNINKLSAIWAEFFNKESGAKRCIRNFICSDDKGASCVAQDLAQAKDIKKAIDADGCEYWLRVYCSIGAKAW